MNKKRLCYKTYLNGFTLVEVLVTVAIVSVLGGIAVPALGTMLAGWQRDKAVKAFTSHLQLARSSAIQHGQRAVMCISDGGTGCITNTTKDWKNGWIVYIDQNANNTLDEGEPIVKVESAHTQIASMLANNNASRFVFKPSGHMSAGMGSLLVAPKEGQTRKITINRVGRLRLSLEK